MKSDLHSHTYYRYSQWQKWFAWRPITLNDNRVWFKFVYRRDLLVRDDMTFITIGHEYTDLFGVLKDGQV